MKKFAIAFVLIWTAAAAFYVVCPKYEYMAQNKLSGPSLLRLNKITGRIAKIDPETGGRIKDKRMFTDLLE